MNPDCRIRLSVTTPSSKHLAVEWLVEETAMDAFEPLDRNHDFPLAFQEMAEAKRRKDARAHVVRMLANGIAQRMIELIEKEDPRHGFTPLEWEAMHGEFPRDDPA